MNFNFKPRKRRGLSSVVGTLFFIVLMVGAFAAILAAFSYQNSLIDTQKTIADLEVAKDRESFLVSADFSGSCTGGPLDNTCLDLTVNNKGTGTVEISKIWVIESQNADGDGNDYEATAYDSTSTSPIQLNYNDLIVPIGTSKLITTNQIPVNSLAADPDDYRIKVVSKLGTIVSLDVPEVGDGPPGPQGLACWDLDGDYYFDNYPEDPMADFPKTIGGTLYNTEDIVDDNLSNGADCQGADGSSGTPPPIDDELLNKPSIFMIFPSPFGEESTTATGVWGVTIVNPSDSTMYVKKIVITTVIPTQSGQNVFPGSGTSGSWTFGGNQIVYISSIAGGDPILTRRAQSFFLTLVPSNTNDENLNGIPVFASVLTNFGQFGKTSYLTSLIGKSGSNHEPIVNAYLSDTNFDSTTDTDGTLTFNPGQTLNPYFTLSDRSTGSTISRINAGSTLVVNVPKDFTVNSADGRGYFTMSPIVPNSDGSTQMIGTLISAIGDTSSNPARSFQLSITAPSMVGETKDKLSVMYILADGKADYEGGTGFQIGPLDEVIIRVLKP